MGNPLGKLIGEGIPTKYSQYSPFPPLRREIEIERESFSLKLERDRQTERQTINQSIFIETRLPSRPP